MDDIIHQQEIRNIAYILENLKLNETRNIKGFHITYIGPNTWPNDGRKQYKYQEYVSFETWVLAG